MKKLQFISQWYLLLQHGNKTGNNKACHSTWSQNHIHPSNISKTTSLSSTLKINFPSPSQTWPFSKRYPRKFCTHFWSLSAYLKGSNIPKESDPKRKLQYKVNTTSFSYFSILNLDYFCYCFQISRFWNLLKNVLHLSSFKCPCFSFRETQVIRNLG
jgi:hypothetical protein